MKKRTIERHEEKDDRDTWGTGWWTDIRNRGKEKHEEQGGTRRETRETGRWKSSGTGRERKQRNLKHIMAQNASFRLKN
jgi:hypothetical protein